MKAALISMSLAFLAPTVMVSAVHRDCEAALPDGSTCPAKGQHLFPDEKHCSMYYECYDGCVYHTMCEKDFLYDADKKWCNYPQMVDCGDRNCDGRPCKPHEPTTDFKCPQPNGLFPDPDNCIKYYHCYNNAPERKTCQMQNGIQLHYDPEHEWCDWPDRVNCGTRPVCDGHDEDCSTQPPLVSTTAKPLTKCSSLGSCRNQGEALEEGHCERCFCVCTNGHYEEICCQQGLVYNLAQNVCDWPYNIGC